MKKKANITLITNNKKNKFTTNIKIKNNKINYHEDNTNVFYDIDEDLLIRENTELYMEILFRKQKIVMYIKPMQKELEIPIKVKKIEKEKNYIKINYKVEEIDYQYIIESEDLYEYN